MGYLMILLTTAPYSHENSETAIKLAEAARKKGHDVQIHLFMDGVYHANKKMGCEAFTKNPDCSYSKRFQDLADQGVEITLCPLCSSYRGILDEDIIKGATMMSLVLFTEKIMFADSFISLGA